MKKMLLMLCASAAMSGADNNPIFIVFNQPDLTAEVVQGAWDNVWPRMRQDTIVAFDCTAIRRVDKAALGPIANRLAHKIQKKILFGEALQEFDVSDFQQLQNTELILHAPSLNRVKTEQLADSLAPKMFDVLKSSVLPFYIARYCANILLISSAGLVVLDKAEYNGCKRASASVEASDCSMDHSLSILGVSAACSLRMLASIYHKHVYREYYPNKFSIEL